MFFCGFLLMYLGVVLWKKNKIELLHDYHYTHVKEKDRKAYTACMGKSLLIMALGPLSGALQLWITNSLSLFVLVLWLVIGIVMLIHGQIKYNGKIF